MRSRQTTGVEKNKGRRDRGYREGSETKNLDVMHTKWAGWLAGWQGSSPGGGGEREEREERKEAQLTRDFKQQTKVEKQRQNRIEIMAYRRIDEQQGRGLHTRERTRESGSRRGGRGTLDVSCLSFKMHTMGLPSLDFGCAARPRARWASHLPGCQPLPAATLAGEPYASVSQQRPLIPAP